MLTNIKLNQKIINIRNYWDTEETMRFWFFYHGIKWRNVIGWNGSRDCRQYVDAQWRNIGGNYILFLQNNNIENSLVLDKTKQFLGLLLIVHKNMSSWGLGFHL